MPKKINVVSLSDIKPIESEDDVSVVNNDEVTQIKETARSASSYANMAEAIKEEEALNPPEDNPVEEASKPKPKRKPPVKKQLIGGELLSHNKVIAKPKVVEETVAVVEPVPEPVIEVKEEIPQKKVKTLELVKCPKCDKEMTCRTLRYDHHKTCPGEKVEREKIPVQRRIKKEVVETKQPPAHIHIPEEIIEQPSKRVLGPEAMLLVEQEVKKRIMSSVQDRLHQRLKLKEEKIKKLATQIA